jgi:beta-lactamase superfamily II metal-dependent hydrolase
MLKKFPLHPILFSLAPLLFLVYRSLDQLHPQRALAAGALWLAGGAVLYLLAYLLTRSIQRAALIASFGVVLAFAYQLLYVLLKATAFGRHRYFAPVFAILLVTGLVFLLRYKPRQWNAWALNAASLVLLLPFVYLLLQTGAWAPPLRAIGLLPPPHLQVTYIDIGKRGAGQPGEIGDAILLQSSEGKTVLIDAGYPNHIAADYLIAHHVTHLDMVVFTHAHDDHAGGLLNVIKEIPIDLIVINKIEFKSTIYQQVEAAIQASGIKTREVRYGDQLPFGSLVFDVYNPDMMNPDVINLNSIVMRLVVGKVSFLFTGDVERQQELRMVASGVNLQADILKLAHHGSDTSSSPEFIAKVHPQVAIYSAGTGNGDGFPRPATMKTLHDAGITVYGTDNFGTIVVVTDGKKYELTPEFSDPN